MSSTMRRFAFPLFALFMLALPALPVPDFWITQSNYIGLYAMVALGLVLLTGVAGFTSFGQAAFVGVGAYTAAFLATKVGVSPWLTLFAGVALAAVMAFLLGLITLRMSGHYLPLATIAWGLALNYTMANMDWLGKYDGLLGIPSLHIFGVDLGTGRGLHGLSTLRYKLVAFVIAAVLAAMSGWLFAHFQRTVNPTPFSIAKGIEYLFIAVLGGVGNVWGAFLGSAVVRIVEDQLQVLLPQIIGTSGNFETIVFGIVLVVVLKYAPDGLWSFVDRWFPAGPRHHDWKNAAALPLRVKPTRGEALLQVVKVRKEFGGLVAVNDVSFEVRAGDIVGLIGPNGAGKSTTFNLITGVLDPTGGSVSFRGAPISGLPSRGIARKGISRTFQHVKMIPEMTVLENVALGGYLRTRSGTLRAMLRLDRAEERRLFAEAERQLARVGMAEHAHELAGNLALGLQCLMEIARALCTDPALMLLDEPAAGLVMEFGTRLMEGTPAEVQASPAVRAAYLGTEH